MAKTYLIKIPCDCVSDYLRYCHLEYVVEAHSEEEALVLIKDYPHLGGELIIDDWRVNDCELNKENITIVESKEER